MDVIARMLGVPAADEEQLRVWTNALLDRDEGVPDVTPAGIDGRDQSLQVLLRFRRRTPRRGRRTGIAPDDLTDRAVPAGYRRRALSDQQVVGFCFLLIIAGNETTTKLLANCLLALQQYPSERGQSRERSRAAFPTRSRRSCATKARRS